MTATVIRFDAKLHTLRSSFDRAEWRDFLAVRGVTHGVSDELVAACEERFRERGDLKGCTVAKGMKAVDGEGPLLVETYKLGAEGAHRDMRELQQRGFVRMGQPIAEIRLKVPPAPGFDVRGQVLQPKLPTFPEIQTDELVEKRANHTFVAKADGIPEVTATSIGLKKALVVPGDVNLATGNIYFRGPVEINGSIDEGATVYIHGDLVVHGMIRGAQVKVSGSIVVDGGIVTGRNGWVKVKGDINASFIENAHVEGGGSISIAKSITASRVAAHGDIKVTDPEGRVIGGELVCLGDLVCANLGRSGGARTKVWAGCDPKANRRLAILEGRLERLEAALKDKQVKLREYRRKAVAQTTKQQVEAKVVLEASINRCDPLIQKLITLVDRAKTKVVTNNQAKVQVSNILSMNCQIQVGNQKVALAEDVCGALVTGVRRKGSFVSALEEPPTADQPKAG